MSSNTEQTPVIHTAVLDLDGANCTSCVYTIEKVGRKFNGVSDIFVDRATQTINLEYNGDAGVIDQLVTIVDRIGYTATLRETGEKTSNTD